MKEDANLIYHLYRYYPNERVARIETQLNALNEPIFRMVYFMSGRYITFMLCDDGKFRRHRGGNRYGPRKAYEGGERR